MTNLTKDGISTPSTLEEFTPAFITMALRNSGAIGKDTTVSSMSFKTLGQGEGFMGILARISISYDGPAGPATVVAKIPTTVPENRASGKAIMIYEREARLYNEILPKLDIAKPKVYAAIYEAVGDEHKSLEGLMKVDKLPLFLLKPLIRMAAKRGAKDTYVPPTVILMEDLGGVAEIGDQVNTPSKKRLTSSLSALAKLHAQTWESKHIPDAHWSKGPQSNPKVIHALFLNAYKDFIKNYKEYLSPHTIKLLKSCKKTGLKRERRLYGSSTWTLAHGDFRLDNMFFSKDDSVRAIIDWQLAAPGPGALDVAYFLMSSTGAEFSEADIDDLLGGYHQELLANGVTGYSYEKFIREYHDCMMITLERTPGITDTSLLEMENNGEERGNELLALWVKRVDARMQRLTLEQVAI